MSAYDDAVAYLDAEVHPRCDYDIYSDMRDIVDDMQAENAKLRELLSMYMTFARAKACGHVVQFAYANGMGKVMDEAEMRERAMELGIEWCR